MRLLVTGGAGFIGSHYVRTVLGDAWALDRPHSVVVLDKLTYAGNLENLRPVLHDDRLEVVEGDIVDATLVGRLMGDVDAVVHFAAESHVDRSITSAAEFMMTNVVGTQTLLDVATRSRVERFVHISTDEVYGSLESGSADEASPLAPSSPYSASKAASDLVALAYHRTHGVPVCVTRCTNNYGPYQFPEKVIPLFVTNLLDGLKVPLYGDGRNVRDWLHVDDHCRAVHLVLLGGRPGEVYNIGSGTEVSNVELTERLLEATGRGWDAVEHVADRPGHDLRYSLDSSKMRAELGWEPRVDMEKALAETVEWYRDNRGWWEPLKDRAALRR